MFADGNQIVYSTNYLTIELHLRYGNADEVVI